MICSISMVMQLASGNVKRHIVKQFIKSVTKSMVAVYSSVECVKMVIDFIGHRRSSISIKIKPRY